MIKIILICLVLIQTIGKLSKYLCQINLQIRSSQKSNQQRIQSHKYVQSISKKLNRRSNDFQSQKLKTKKKNEKLITSVTCEVIIGLCFLIAIFYFGIYLGFFKLYIQSRMQDDHQSTIKIESMYDKQRDSCVRFVQTMSVICYYNCFKQWMMKNISCPVCKFKQMSSMRVINCMSCKKYCIMIKKEKLFTSKFQEGCCINQKR